MVQKIYCLSISKGRHILLPALIFFGLLPAFAQQPAAAKTPAQLLKVAGKVVDGKTNEAILGAQIQEKENPNNGTVSDIDGNFSLEVSPTGTLIVRYLGYATREIPVNHSAEVNISLNIDEKVLNEVVVIGYGSQKVKDLTAPISVVQGQDLSKQIAANPMAALQGKVAGVQIINSGAPGAGPSVKIRGVGSIGDYANPLYVVDGVFVDDINFLNSSDIETMNVLKDASAAAIYGVRAANGVVLITTKKGFKGKTSITYDGYAGVQVPVNIMPLANRDQYVELLNLANQNTTGYQPKDASAYPTSTDWYQKLVRNALMQSHALDISGANDQTNYSVGLNYFYQNGIMNSKNDYDRVNLRGRIDQVATNWLKVGLTTVISNYTQYMPSSSLVNTIFSQAYVNPPVYPVYDPSNTAAYPVNFGSPQSYGFSNSYGNPVATAYYNNSKETGIKTIFSTYAEITFIPDKLKWKTAYNLNYNQWNAQLYQPEYFVGGSQGLTQSQLSKTFGIETKQIVDNTLTYNDAIDRHQFSVMLGQSSRIEKQSTMTGTAVNVPGYDDQSIYLVNGSSQNQTATDAAYRYNGLSFFMRGTYNYADKYLATLTFRADGSSKYNQHWGYFPSLGLGWTLTNEDFMKNQHWTDYLKLRASWGLLGNDNVPANSSYILGTTGAASSGVFGNRLVDGVGAQTVYSNFLKWEVVNEFNVGVDSRFLKNRLSAELDYYNRTTSNVVFSAPIATGGGVTELLANNGTVRNQGLELTLNWDDKLNKNFGYHIGLNATTISNKVLALNGRDTPIPGALVRGNYATSTQVGYPIGSFWGYQIAGVYASQGDALRDPVGQTIKDVGYFKYKDQNGDNVIDDKDKVYLGSPIPKLIAGLDFGANWRNIDVSLNIQGQFGNKMLNAKRMNRDVFADGNYDLDFYANAWRTDNPPMIQLDKFTYDPSNTLISELWQGYFDIVSAADNALYQMPLFEAAMQSDANKQQTLECAAEAKVIRAYAYFNLTRMFGRVPIVDSLMTAEQLAGLQQASTDDLYKFILKDLDEAIPVLPESYTSDWAGRITKYTAMGIKAKVHLYRNDWDSVASLTDQIMASGRYGLLSNFRDEFSMSGENSKESLFEIQSSTLGKTTGDATYLEYAYVQGPRSNSPGNMQGWGFCTPSNDLIQFFTQRGETVRAATTFLYRGTITPEGDSIKMSCANPVYNGKVYTPSSYNNWSYNGYGFDYNVRILRYSDILLMFAEAKLRGASTGNTSGYTALAAINEVRERVKLDPLTALTLQDVWDERRAELALEEDRFFDLIRTGQAATVLKSLGYVEGKNNVFPIPSTQMQLNHNLVQNSGY